jgi:hypothetical protein
VIETIKSQFSDVRSFERHLRDEGCSIREAKTVIHDLRQSNEMEDERLRDVDPDVVDAVEMTVNKILAGMIRHR